MSCLILRAVSEAGLVLARCGWRPVNSHPPPCRLGVGALPPHPFPVPPTACLFLLQSACLLGTSSRDCWVSTFSINCKAMQNNTKGSGRLGDTAGDEDGEWD